MMKITKQQLKQIIKEELAAVLDEREITVAGGKKMTLPDDPIDDPDWGKDVPPKEKMMAALEWVPPKEAKVIKDVLKGKDVGYELEDVLNYLDKTMPETSPKIRAGLRDMGILR